MLAFLGYGNNLHASDSLEVVIQGMYPKGKYKFCIDTFSVKEKIFKHNTVVSYTFYIKIDTSIVKPNDFRLRIVIGSNNSSEQTVFYIQKLKEYNSVFIYKHWFSTKKFSYNIEYYKDFILLNDIEEIDPY